MSIDSSESVVVEGRLRFSEFLRFNYWFLWRRYNLFIILIALVAFVYPPLAILGALGPNAVAAEGKSWTYAIWPTISVALVVLIYVAAKRAFLGNKHFNQLTRYEFSADGIAVSSPLASSRCSWEGIEKAEETSALLLLWMSKGHTYLIPKRYFEEVGALQQLRTLLTRQLGSRATLEAGA